MRAIYTTVLSLFIVSVFLFIVSFAYLDRHNHITYYYDVSVNGQYSGTIKVDKFITEDKFVYKSVSNQPFMELFTEERARLDADRRYGLESYQKELFANGGEYLFYAEKRDNSVSFMTRPMSQFTCLGNVPVRKGIFVFEEDSPVTYLPIIENYDFKRGGAQGFNSLVYASDSRLPPAKKFVTLTSIKNEYLKVDRRKIKTENLLLKIKGLPSGSVWVARSDRSLIMIEIPSIGLKISRVFGLKEKFPKKRAIRNEKYTSREITFHGKNSQLSGTFTSPSDEITGKTAYPAVLLVWGAGPQDRDYQGFFESIADYLSQNGYCVLRFDKSGIGSSGGNSSSTTRDDEFDDINAALNFLKSQKNVNINRISVIAHSEGAFNAIKLASEGPDIRGVILMAPSVYLEPQDAEAALRARAAREKWDDEYLNMALRAIPETNDRANKTKRDWGYVMGKRCYLKSIRVGSAVLPKETIQKVSTPILILQGKNDSQVSAEQAARADKALSDYGSMRHSVTYFSYLGHFFGKLINDGSYKMHYAVDKEVLVNIKDWLDMNTAEPVKIEPPQGQVQS